MLLALWGIFVSLFCAPDLVGCEPARRVASRMIGTKYGSLRGLTVSFPNAQRNFGAVEVFLGVPYASPPIGHLRFMPPVNPMQWRSVRIADRYGPVCPQRYPDIRNETDSLRRMPSGRLEYLRKLIPFLRNESEDCLYLNIYTPVKREGSKLPAMVFIHGESYEWNSGNPYDGTVLAGFGEVIVVTLNYRLGILGFLPAMEAAARGNYGLMDQIAALHWVQENIGQFGGDPRNITLLGHGHGASCAHLLMLSPMAKGLFQRVVLQSGSALSPWAVAREAMTYTRHVARILGCPALDHPALVRCMRQRPLSDLMRVQLMVPEYLTAFGPTVDGIVIPGDPEDILKNPPLDIQGGSKHDILVGTTRIEAFFHFGANEERYGIEASRRDRLLRTLVRNLFSFHLQEIFLTIVNEYTDWTRPVQHPVNILDGTVDALTDALVVAPSVNSANLLSRLRHRTFLYVFNYPTEASDYPQRLGCVHGEDLPYLFGAPLVSSLAHFPHNFSKAEIALSEAVMLYWTNFAKFGDPNVVHDLESPDKTRGRFERFLWPSYDIVNQKYLSLGMKPKIRDHYHAHRLSFWLSLIPKLHRQGTSLGVAPQHHLLEDHDNPQTYDGIVRQVPLPPSIGQSSSTTTPTSLLRHGLPYPNNPTVGSVLKMNEIYAQETTSSRSRPSNGPHALVPVPPTPLPSGHNVSGSLTASSSMAGQKDAYATALSVTIAVGCSLLVLNIFIFAAVYYQRDKHRLGSSLKHNQCKNRRCSQLESAPLSGKPHPSIRAPPPSPDIQRNSQFMPPMLLPTVSPSIPQSPVPPNVIPLQEVAPLRKPSIPQEGHSENSCHPTKVRWAPDTCCEGDRDAVWL